LVNTTNEFGPLQMDANGRLKVEAFSGETLPVSLTSTTITGTVAVTQSGTWDEIGINDSGNSITVDNGGTFAVQVDGSALTSLQLIDDAIYGDDAARSKTMGIGAIFDDAATTAITENQAGYLRMSSRRALLVEGVASGTALNVLDTNSASALTSLQLMDDVIFTDDTSTHATGTTKGTGMMAVANPTDSAVDANDIGMLAMTLARALKNDITTIAGTAPTTAGFIDIKGADGNVFVRQTTASNLNMTEASAASILTSVQLIDDMIFTDNGAYTDNSSKLAVVGYYFDETAGTALTENDVAAARIDSKRAQVLVIEDGTTRGLRAGVVDETGTNAVDAVAVGGGTPHDSVDSGNPVKVGFKAQNALPTAVANNDRSNGISDLWGRQMTTHIDPAQQIHKSFNATSTQTGIDVWSPTSGKKIAVTSVVIGTYGTTAARIILWFGDNADTTYTAGTDQLLLAFSSAPSTTSKPGLVYTPAVPVFCTTADRELHITTDAGISIDVAVEGYEW
jgi:hypothetical protein